MICLLMREKGTTKMIESFLFVVENISHYPSKPTYYPGDPDPLLSFE